MVQPLFEGSVNYFGQYKHRNPASAHLLSNSGDEAPQCHRVFRARGISVDVDGSHDGEIHSQQWNGC